MRLRIEKYPSKLIRLPSAPATLTPMTYLTIHETGPTPPPHNHGAHAAASVAGRHDPPLGLGRLRPERSVKICVNQTMPLHMGPTQRPSHPDPPQPSPARHRPRSSTSPSCVLGWDSASCLCSCAGASSSGPRTARRSSGGERPARQQGPGRGAVRRACRLSHRAAPSWRRRSACRDHRRDCLLWGNWKR